MTPFTRSMAKAGEKIRYVLDQPTIMACIIEILMRDNSLKTEDLCNLYSVIKSNVRSSEMLQYELKILHYNHFYSMTISQDITRCVTWINKNYISKTLTINKFHSKSRIDCFLNCLKHIHGSHATTLSNNQRLKDAIHNRIIYHKNYIHDYVISGIPSINKYICKLNFYEKAFHM